jgi:hypothetical protein
MAFPLLSELLSADAINISITDRQTKQVIMTVWGCRPASYSTSLSAKHVQELSVTFVGMTADEDSNQNEEGGDAAQLGSVANSAGVFA